MTTSKTTPFNRGPAITPKKKHKRGAPVGTYTRKHEVCITDAERARLIAEFKARGGKVQRVSIRPLSASVESIPQPDWAELEAI